MATPTYNTAVIRELLNTAFTSDEISDLSYDYFRQVFDGFSSGMTKGQKIQALLEYCDRRLLIPELLNAIQHLKPDKYEPYRSQFEVNESSITNSDLFIPGSTISDNQDVDSSDIRAVGSDRTSAGSTFGIDTDVVANRVTSTTLSSNQGINISGSPRVKGNFVVGDSKDQDYIPSSSTSSTDDLSKQITALRSVSDEAQRAAQLKNLVVQIDGSPQAGRLLKQAVDVANSITDLKVRLDTIIDLIPHLPDDLRSDVIDEVRSALFKLPDYREKVEIFEKLAPYLPEGLGPGYIADLLGPIHNVTNEADRADFIVTLARYLPDESKTTAVSAVNTITDEDLRAQVLAQIFGTEEKTGAGTAVKSGQEETPAGSEPQPTPQPVEQIDQVDSRALADVWSKEDYLGFREYAKALADFIRNPKTGRPLTISIDAPWGMGKTTLMHLVEDELKETQAAKPGKKAAAQQQQADPAREKVEVFPTVWFNAWKYDQEESLWAALVLEILDQIRRKPYFGPRKRFALWRKLNWKRLDKGALLRKVLKSVGVVLGIFTLGVVLFLAAALLLQGSLQQSVGEILGKYLGAVGVLSAVSALYAAGKEAYDTLSGPFDLKIADYIREPNYKERVGFLGEFAADFERVVEAITGDGKRPLIIFIDDLDRCAPPKPTEIIEAINVLLDAKYCVFIIGMDTRAVAASIEVKYKDLEEYLVDDAPGEDLPLGYHFLEKIVQFNFRVPRASPEMITRFIRASLGTAERPAAPAPTTAEVSQAKEQIQEKIESGKTETQAYQEVHQEAVQYGTASTVAAVEEARQQVFAISFDDSHAVEQAVQKAAPYFDYNPRKIKRFINYYRLQALIAKRLGLLDNKTIRLDLLATWLLITMRWPGVLEELSDNRDLFGHLKQAYEVSRYLKQADRDPKVVEDYEASLNPQVRTWSEDAELITLLGEITQQSAGAWSTYFDLTQMTSGSHAMAAPTVQMAK